jgi:2-dehydropantoate 2-reductase
MRASIGDVLAAGGEATVIRLLNECAGIADSAGHALRPEVRQRFLTMLTTPGSKMTASMLRDIERGAPIEVEHVLGDLIARRAAPGLPATALSVLDFVCLQLRSYEARRLREGH